MFNTKKFSKILKRIKKLRNSKFAKNQVVQVSLVFFLFSAISLTLYNLAFLGRIFPGVYIAGINVGTKTIPEAIELLENEIVPPTTLVLKLQDKTFEVDLETLDFSYDLERSSLSAYGLSRTGNIIYDQYRKLLSPFRRSHLGLRVNIDQKGLKETLAVIAGQVIVEPIYPSASYKNKVVAIEKGKAGTTLDTKALSAESLYSLSFAKTNPIFLTTDTIDPTLTDEEADAFRQRAEQLVGKTLSFEFEFQNFVYKENDIFKILNPLGDYKEEAIESLVEEIADQINRDPQNPVFVFEGGRVQEFAPAKEGVLVKVEELKGKIITDLRELEATDTKLASINIPVDSSPADLNTKEVNNLGINELLGRGTSRFSGSIASRIYNIGHAAGKFNGVLVEPGEIFSFNNTLGDVSTYTGYKQAYIIKDGQTVLGDGGGVCQVSTTFFRAVLDAGLPVVERRAHSYRVGYYEQDSPVGFDATVYSPTTDLKIKNDTPAHILIQTYFEPKTASLTFEIYGTNDGRIATTTKPVVSGITAPPEDLYTDDPNLPAGKIEQIDYKAWGAKASFKYTVERDGEVIQSKTFYSNYQPWQAKFLRGTGPVNE